ncbi:RHS repeat-associated core domain-containing protein [Pseudomonas moorei]|uniref:RHS repeat-associated core domain-containing protein n=1 Tax=Pseudomonas moorei TaxID=395599 RepID=UPI001FF4566A|nr:RHS repeat-associated core domain-containing protein [Pseudomonas moorei]
MSQSKQPWLIRYHYDPLDQMTSHTVSDTPARLRFYRKNRLTTEIQGAVGYSIVQHDDLLLAQQQHQQNAHDTTLLATDLQRSPLHTLKKNAQPQPIAYSPYGHRSVVSALLSLLGFNGERLDPVTGHYILGNYRAFNPVLMRFNSPDSLSPFGKGGVNSYAYCLGDPISGADPSGHFTKYLFDPTTRRLNFGNGTSWATRPGVSNTQAKKTVNNMNRTESKKLHASEKFHQRIKLDREQNYIPTSKQPISLQRLSANTISSDSRIDLHQLPNPLQKFVENNKVESDQAKIFYREITNENGVFIEAHLVDLAGANFRNSQAYNPTIKDFAIAYQKRLSELDTARDRLITKLWRIRDSAFVPDRNSGYPDF